MRSLSVSIVCGVLSASILIAGCSQAAPAPPPVKPAATAAPAAQPTAAPAPAQPTVAPAAPKVEYPQKGRTISVIIPFDAGGATDIGARLLVPGMEEKLGVPIQVVNKPGANSQIGVTELANSKPDGYTLGMTNTPAAMTPYLDPERKAQYGRKDLQQVALQVVDPEMILVRSDSPYKTLKDLTDAAKAKPDKLTMVDDGIGGAAHLAALQYAKVAGVKFGSVHMTGGGPAMVALEGGQTDAGATAIGNVGAQLKRGVFRVLGIMEKQRSKFAPDIPTFEELGYKVYFGSTRGFTVRSGTPKEIVDLLSAAVKNAMEKEDVKKRMDDSFLAQNYMDAAQYTAYWDEVEKQTAPLLELVKAEAATK